MIVYIDLLIISTIVVNYCFIKTISIIFKEKLSKLRVILSLVISVLIILMFFLPYNIFFIVRYFMGIIIGVVAFKTNNIKTKIVEIAIFYILTMCFISILFIFRIKDVMLFILSIVYVIALFFISTYKQDYLKLVLLNKKKIKALVDTGNLSSYKQLPIVFLSKKYKTNEFSFVDDIYINTFNSNVLASIYKGPLLIVDKKKVEVLYCFEFNSNDEFDMIIPPL